MQRRFISEVATTLRAYARGESRSGQCDQLVSFAAALPEQYLRRKIGAAARNEEVDDKTLSLSVIGGLFYSANEGHTPLQRALQEHLDAGDSELYLQFRRIVLRWTSQELFHRWKESDPVGARLQRNLKRSISRSQGLITFPADRPRWIALSQSPHNPGNYNVLPFGLLASIVAEEHYGSSSPAEVAKALLQRAEERQRAPVAIELNTLLTLLRELLIKHSEVALETLSGNQSINLEFTEAIQRSRTAACISVSEKLAKYQMNEKLSEHETAPLRLALADLIDDCVDGGPALTYYEYLSKHWPDLSRELYRNRYRTRFEYLAELAQAVFEQTIRQYYEE